MTAFIQIPNLPAAIALNGTEQFEVVQAGVSVRVTSAQIAALVPPPPPLSPIPVTETYTSGGTFQLDGVVQDVVVKLAAAAVVDLTLPTGNPGQRLAVMDAGGTASNINHIRIHAPTTLNAITGSLAYTDIDTPYGWVYFKCVSPGVWIIVG